jgi:hypothetical protein
MEGSLCCCSCLWGCSEESLLLLRERGVGGVLLFEWWEGGATRKENVAIPTNNPRPRGSGRGGGDEWARMMLPATAAERYRGGRR